MCLQHACSAKESSFAASADALRSAEALKTQKYGSSKGTIFFEYHMVAEKEHDRIHATDNLHCIIDNPAIDVEDHNEALTSNEYNVIILNHFIFISPETAKQETLLEAISKEISNKCKELEN
eukprot:8520530-Ditylum_brightwellii.AAC.2